MTQNEAMKRNQVLNSLENLQVIVKAAQGAILGGGYEVAFTTITLVFDTERDITRKRILELAEIADKTYV